MCQDELMWLAELSERSGVPIPTMESRWRNKIRPALAESLEHLRAA